MAIGNNALDAWRSKYVNPVTGGAESSVGGSGLSGGGSALDSWREKYVTPVTTPKQTAPVPPDPVVIPPVPENNTPSAAETDGGSLGNFFTKMLDLFTASQNMQQASEMSIYGGKKVDAIADQLDTKAEQMITPAKPEVGYVGERGAVGAAQSTEGIINALGYMGQALNRTQNLQASQDAAMWGAVTGSKTQKALSERLEQTALDSAREGLKDTVSFGDEYDEKVEQKYAGADISDLGRGAAVVSEGIGGMLPNIAMAAIAPGTALSSVGMFLSSMGNATQEAKKEGYSDLKAMAYGSAVGAVEVATEKMFDGLSGVFGKGAFDDVVKNTIRKTFKSEAAQKAVNYLVNAAGEGVEEFVSELGTRIANELTINNDDRTVWQTFRDGGKSFLVGSLISGIMQAGGNVTQLIRTDPAAAAQQVADSVIAEVKSGTEQVKTQQQEANSGFIPGSGLDGTPAAMDGVIPVQDRVSTQTTPSAAEQTAPAPGVNTYRQVGAVEGEKRASTPAMEVEANTLPLSAEVQKKERLSKAGNMLEYTGIAVDVDDNTISVAQRLSDVTGREILFYRSDRGENGYYSKDDQTIWVNANSENPVAQIISHELTHSVEFAEAYNELSALVQVRLAKSGADVEQMLQDKKVQYAEWGKELDDRGAMQEVVAEYISQNLLTDEATITEMARNNPTLVQKIVNFFDGLLAKVGVKSSRERTEIRKMRDTYWRALQQAGTGYGVSTDTTMQRMSAAYAAEELTEEDFDDAVDVVMEEESAAGKSMLEGNPLSRQMSGEGVQYSIEQLPDGKKYVRADRQVIFGNDPDSWSEQLEDYINGKIRRGQDVELIAEDGDVLVLTKDTAGKVSSPYKGASRMSDAAFERKVNAGAHIDELAQVSVRGKENAADEEGRHGEAASDGWNYRKAFFHDFDGKYYLCTISVAVGENGNKVYNIGKMQERSFPTAQKALDGSSVKDGAQREKTSSGDSVPQSKSGVKNSPPGIIPREQYSYTNTPERGMLPVDEGYWNSIMEQGRIPFMESDQPGYAEALLADMDKQNVYTGASREMDPMEGIIPNADTAQQAKAEEPSVEINNLPTKAANALKKAENAMLKVLGDNMSVPGVAQRDYLKPIVQQISEEYLHTGDVSRETADALFAEAWKQGLEVDNEFYEENKHIKDYLRTTKITVGDDIKADFADWSSWKQRAFGSLRMVDSGGLGVDTAYQELSDMNPGLFPDSITATSDQLQRMYDVAKSIRQVETTLEAAHAGDAVYEQWAKQQFEDALAKMRLELRNVKRFTLDRAEQLAREETTDLTLDDVKALYPKLKDARRQYERAQAKNLLTAGDAAMVNRILRGDAELESLDPAEYNLEGIRAVYEAKQEYENYAKQIRRWNQSRKAALRSNADTFLRTANAWKDKAKGILYSRETMERNVRDIVPDDQLADQVVREYFTPVHDAVADATRTKNAYRDRVRALNLSTKISKADAADGKVSEAHAVQLLGEAQDSIRMLERSRGRMKERDGKTLKDWKAVVENLWANNPQLDQAKIESAVEEFRKIYDELFTQMNEARVRNGYEPVNYRSGYFPHFQPGDGDGVLVQFGKALGIDTAVTALPTNINGLSHTFKPGITWMGNAQERLGFNTVYDAVEGFDKYIEGVADVIHLTDSIQNLRAFASQMRYRTTEQGIRDQVDTIRSDERLTAQEKEDMIQNLYNDPKTKYVLGNFVVELDEYINLLANKKSRADRNMEQALGRDAYNVVKGLESRVAANMVAVNPASWLTNFIPLTQGWAGVTSKHMLRGMQDTLKNVKTDDGIVGQSSFLTNRQGSDPLVQTWAQKASEKASEPMRWIDTFTAGSLVRARYYQNIERGMSGDAAMEEADGWVAGVMADRSKGSTPTLFNRSNPITKLFTQFQLEVNNQLGYVFKDIPRDMKDKGVAALAGALLKFALGAFLFDEIYEYFIGRRPALDPIGILNDTVGDLTGYELPNLIEGTVSAVQGDGFFEKGERVGVGQAAGNLLGNVAGELPFTSVLSVAGIDVDQGRIPVSSAMPDISTISSVIGDSGWGTKKRLKEGLEEAAKPLTYLALPFGGGQLKKVGQGLYATVKGGSYTVDAEGNEKLQYPVYNDNAWEAAKSFVGSSLFGKTALPTGQDWVESGFPTLSVKETQAYKNMTEAGISGEDAWGWIQLMKDADGTIGKLTAIADSGATDEAAQELFGVVMGKEMETDAGNPTQYAKMLEAMAEGLTAAEYVTYRQATYKLTKKSEKLEALQAAGFTAAEAARLLEQLG